MPNSFFEVSNAYYIGDFQQCIAEANKTEQKDDIEKCFMYRSYIAQRNYSVVLTEVKPSDPLNLQSLRLLAMYFTATEQDEKEKIKQEMKEKLAAADEHDYIALSSAATIECLEDNPEGALKILHSSEHLECMAMMVQSYLRMDRIDCALKELKEMMAKNEDCTLTQLAIAWVDMFVGGDKLTEAQYIFKELSDKYTDTPLLSNGLAVSHMMQSNYDECKQLLQASMAKNIYDSNTMVNLMHYFYHFDKDNEANRLLQQMKDLKTIDKTFAVQLESKNAEFDRLCKQYAIE